MAGSAGSRRADLERVTRMSGDGEASLVFSGGVFCGDFRAVFCGDFGGESGGVLGPFCVILESGTALSSSLLSEDSDSDSADIGRTADEFASVTDHFLFVVSVLALVVFDDDSEVGTAFPGCGGVATCNCCHVIGASVMGACIWSGEAVEVDDSPSARCAGDRVSAPTPLGPAATCTCETSAVEASAGSSASAEVGDSGISTGSLGPGAFARAFARCSGYMPMSIHAVRK